MFNQAISRLGSPLWMSDKTNKDDKTSLGFTKPTSNIKNTIDKIKDNLSILNYDLDFNNDMYKGIIDDLEKRK